MKGEQTMIDLKAEVLAYRAEHNISQRAMAKKCNLTLQTICNIENGKASPTKLTQAKILKVIRNQNGK